MLDAIQFKEKTLEVPIIQGGMGVGVSLSNLAGAVMKEGGMGVISAAHPGYLSKDFKVNSLACNLEAIKDHAEKARALSNGRGLLAINIMSASKQYDQYVRASVDAGYDAIISGAGLPLSLPEYIGDSNILLGVIVSSSKAFDLIVRMWKKRYDRLPDFVVIEGSLAGGHLGFKEKDLFEDSCQSLDSILADVLKSKNVVESQYDCKIPVFVAGGIFDGKDIAHYVKAGASGVQMGTRFIATEECDADPRFKEMIVNAKKEDIGFVKSPTGFPGRAIHNDFVKKMKGQSNQKVTTCLGCLKPCNPADTPYCISKALIEAVKGNVDSGLVFVGANAYRVKEIVHVHTLMNELIEQAKEALK